MLTRIIPSYLYAQYQCDDALLAFRTAFNDLAQNYLDTMRGLDLSNFTVNPQADKLLDWVAEGLYGHIRPTFPTISLNTIGPFNTYPLNTEVFNGFEGTAARTRAFFTSDDTFRRVITWHTYRDDGFNFSVLWLKRRVARFLEGREGLDPETYDMRRISVQFGLSSRVNIRLLSGVRTFTGGAIPGRFLFARRRPAQLTSAGESFPPIPESYVFIEAVASGVLELPFQYSWTAELGRDVQVGPFTYRP